MRDSRILLRNSAPDMPTMGTGHIFRFLEKHNGISQHYLSSPVIPMVHKLDASAMHTFNANEYLSPVRRLRFGKPADSQTTMG